MLWNTYILSMALDIDIDYFFECYGCVQFNSKDIKPGDIFIALKHSQDKDGHNYINEAILAGAIIVIANKNFVIQNNFKNIIYVDCTFLALEKMAIYKRNNTSAKIIGITGSVGKTTVKEAINIMLKNFGITFASRKNFNNLLGTLINLASIPNNVEYIVMEMGMSQANELRTLTKYVRPNIAIITLIAPAHLAFFNTIEDIVEAKCEIFEGLTKDGIAIINADDKYHNIILYNLFKLGIKNEQVYTFGILNTTNASVSYCYGTHDSDYYVEFNVLNKLIKFGYTRLPKHIIFNFTICFIIAQLFFLDIDLCVALLKNFKLIEGRGNIVDLVLLNTKSCKILCDYYNSNPTSLKASLEYFKFINSNNKIAIIGDMLELGSSAINFHISMVPYIVNSGVDKVCLIGDLVKNMIEYFPTTLNVSHFLNVDLILNKLFYIIDDESLILIKGSNNMNLNKILQFLNTLK